MKLIVGLGNPGKKYQNNRHNIGFMIIDFLAASFGITNYELSGKGKTQYAWLKMGREKAEILKPQTFMNNSGFSVADVKKNHPDLESCDVCVIHDDLDIRLGLYKLQLGKGPHQHNGVLSVEQALKTKNFWRLRVGIENRIPRDTSSGSGEAYVLSNFAESELKQLESEVFPKACLEVTNWLLKREIA